MSASVDNGPFDKSASPCPGDRQPARPALRSPVIFTTATTYRLWVNQPSHEPLKQAADELVSTGWTRSNLTYVHRNDVQYASPMQKQVVVVRPIVDTDAIAVGQFLHEYHNKRVPAAAWARIIAPPWEDTAVNHGFQLLYDDSIVGVYAAIYSAREIDGERVPFCNLAAFCVLKDYRTHAIRLIRALLAQKEYIFTDLSPSGNVIAMNERLGFRHLDTGGKLVVNLPRRLRRGTRVTTDPAALDRTLVGHDATVYRDHRQAPAAQHLLVEHDGGHGYLMFRQDRRKRLPVFASPLYVGGEPGCLEAAWAAVGSHLLLRYGLVATLAERRVLGFAPGPGIELIHPRPKMFRARQVDDEAIDYLYSELTLVQW